MALGSILITILGLSLLIFVHEAGHFLAARLAGVRVEVFSIGFGNRLCGFVWRGTDFRLSAVPFGGYVMVAGQDPGDHRYPPEQSLHGKGPGQRALFWCGGVMMNLLLALIVFPLVFHAGVPFTAPVVGAVQFGGAAWEAGIEAGERVRRVGEHEVLSFENLQMRVALGGARPTTLLLVGHDGAERTVEVTPHWNRERGLFDLGIDPPARDEPPFLRLDGSGPAAAAGLQDGDLLLAVDGLSTVGPTLREAMQRLDEAKTRDVLLRVRSGDAELEVRVRAELQAEPSAPLLGLYPLPRRVVGLRTGDAAVAALGLRRGDVLLAIDGRAFTGGDLAAALAEGDPSPTVECTVARDGGTTILRAAIPDRAAFASAVALGDDGSLLLLPQADGAAAAAGLRAGDRLLRVDGEPVRDFKVLRKLVQRAGDQPLRLTLARARGAAASIDPERHDLVLDDTVELDITPRRAPVHSLGFTPLGRELNEVVRGDSVLDSIRLGVACSFDMVKQIYLTLKRLVTGEVGTNNLGGIIRMGTVSYQAAQRGQAWFWYLLAMLSVNLAIVNLLPIPVLDGGHLLFVAIEKVKGSPVSSRIHGYSQIVGLVFVLMLVLFVTYNDILWLL